MARLLFAAYPAAEFAIPQVKDTSMPKISSTLGEDLAIRHLMPAKLGGAESPALLPGHRRDADAGGLPYAAKSVDAMPQSVTDFFVFADTVTIAEDLLNPGSAIHIFAREIIFQAGTMLDVSGAPPVPTWPAGFPAPQPSPLPSAPGVTGMDANSGYSAGDIQLYADLFKVSGPYTGDTTNRAISFKRALQRAIAAATLTFMATPNINAFPLSLPAVGNFAPANAVLRGLINLNLGSSGTTLAAGRSPRDVH